MNSTATTTTIPAAVDIATMRHCISRLLGPDVPPPAGEELAVREGLVRGHMQLIIPEVERAALARGEDDVPRYCALACVGEARSKLSAPAGSGPDRALAHARRLARCLAALCDHYEALTDVAMCLACDQPLREGDETLPHDHTRPSGPATPAGRIHARCAHTVRRR
ncbi:DUF6415 family natural product biosynthesis protein [Streptomyces chartreusis]|uniref:DUF6415 family natural product biosynthesis protein n=1 Tax=Streptomyces chartreusis TaxID=1969 RepID=UPI0036C90660